MRNTSVAGALGPSGSRLSPRGGHCNCSGWANLATASPTISCQWAMRLVSLMPRTASAGRTTSPRQAPSGLSRGAAGFAHGVGQVKAGLMADSLDRARAALKRRGVAADALSWWDRHRRDLPWRARPGERPDPYRVWLSEVLLQQTTAAGAAPYFLEFMRRWPKVEALAAAPLEEVMRVFAGLGYYSRARNLHACAKRIAAPRRPLSRGRSGAPRAAGGRALHRRGDRGDRIR